jgi:hypothetical protein
MISKESILLRQMRSTKRILTRQMRREKRIQLMGQMRSKNPPGFLTSTDGG